MIITQCSFCAVDLGLTLGKKCGRCSTRYCGAACQVQHWKEGGHDQLCKKIKKAGGAEQYNANKKYAEAVAVAVEQCADDTKGQTCYICTQALHWKTKEGLVRMCACRGTAGFAHVSCLAEQAKILFAEAEENNLGAKVLSERSRRWSTCSLCEQNYHGDVRCALGWACWKTYLGRPERDQARGMAMNVLGLGLDSADHDADALSVREAELSMRQRVGSSAHNILAVQANLACTYGKIGRNEQASQMDRDVYRGRLELNGEEHEKTLRAAFNYASGLARLERFEEAGSLLRKTIPAARRVLGETRELMLKMKKVYADTLYMDPAATLDDLREAVTTLEDTERTTRRVFGISHPTTDMVEYSLQNARAALRTRESGDVDVASILEAVGAMTARDG